MVRERRKFSREFKLEAVRLATSGDRTVAQVARQLGVRADLLHKWERLTRLEGDAFPGNGRLSAQDDEIRRLRRELALVREERDILKKATAFFAKESR